MVLNVLLWIHIQSFLYKYIVLPHFGLDARLTVVISFGFCLQPQRGCSEKCAEVSRRGQRGAEGVLSFEMPCAIVLPPFLTFSFFYRLFFKLQMPKNMPTDTTLPQWLLPRAFSQVALNFFPPQLRFFLPFFLSIWATIFR